MANPRRMRWPIVLTGLAALGIGVIIVRGAMQASSTTEESRITDAVDLAPRPLGEEERSAAGGGIDPQSGVRLEAGAWVEVADPATGRLAQRYRAEQLEPMPDQWMRLAKPRATFFAGSGRVVTVEGNEAVAHVPRRALDSGRIDGNVVIRMYRPVEGRAVDPSIDPPMLEVHTDEADFDAALGQLRCERVVDVRTPALRFTGRGLTMLLDAEGDAPERVEVDEPLAPIRIDLIALKQEQRGDAPTSQEEAKSSVRPTARQGDTPGVAAAAPPASGAIVPSSVPGAAPAAPAGALPATLGDDAPSSSVVDPRFFRLVLHDDVKVVRERDGERSTLEGDQLAIIFSLEGTSLRDAVAMSSRRPLEAGPVDARPRHVSSRLVGAATGGVPQQIATLALGGTPDDPAAPAAAAGPESDVLTITYTGRLIMLPSSDPEDQLPSIDDTRIEILGAPIHMEDPAKSFVGRCHKLRYDSIPQRLELWGSPSTPLEFETPRFQLLGERFWIARGSGNGRLEGPGTMTMRGEESAHGADPLGRRDRAIATAIDDAFTAILVHVLAAPQERGTPQNGEAAGAAAAIPLEIVWRDGVDLRFDPAPEGEESGRLRAADFSGDVRVTGEDFRMRSDRLNVGFEGEGDTEESISAIVAKGSPDGQVKVERLGEAGEMDADDMTLMMTRHEGKTIPKRLIANGSVAVRDAAQTIRAQSLDVSFRPKKEGADGDVRVPGGADGDVRVPGGADGDVRGPAGVRGAGGLDGPGAGRQQDPMGNIEIETVFAERDVRVQLDDGARVYADRLTGDSLRGTLRLEGEDVMIVRERVVADRMRDVRFDDATRTVHAPGPGRFRHFAQAPPLPPLEDVARPQIAAAPTLEANWTDSMHHDDLANAGGGEIRLLGTVDVRSSGEPRVLDTVRSSELRLGLAKVAKPVDVARAGASSGESGAPSERPRRSNPLSSRDDEEAASRDLVSMTAIGGADIEAKRWASDDRSGLPEQLFRVRGENVFYDFRSRNARVDGAGQLLVHDVTPDPEQAAAGEGNTSNQSAFGRRGTSAFTFSNGMTMESLGDDRSLITLDGGVEVLYAGVRPADQLTLTGDRLEITIRRSERNGQVAQNTRDENSGIIDLGGGAEVLRVRAIGRVVVRAPEQDIHCWEFDFNAATSIAKILAKAGSGSMAHVDMRGSTTPLRAASMVWDLQRGTIQLQQAGAAIGR